jgi:hypothetical protein
MKRIEMKIVVFFDAVHQRKYFDVVREAMSGDEDVIVEAAGVTAINNGSEALFAPQRRWRLPLPLALRRSAVTIKLHAKRNLRVFLEGYRSNAFMGERVWQVARKFIRAFRPAKYAIYNFFYRSTARVYLSDKNWRSNIRSRVFSRRPDLLITLEDNAEGLSGLVSHTARARGIPYVILPDFIPNPAEPACHYYNNPNNRGDTVTGRLVRYFDPKWAIRYDGKSILRLPAQEILVQRLNGQKCVQPWILNAGYAEAIFLESKSALRHYEKLGFRKEKLRVIGGAIEDALYAICLERSKHRHSLNVKYGLDPEATLVICGFPPDQYSAATGRFEFASYGEMCTTWFRVLNLITDKANVLVVPHPRLDVKLIAAFCNGKIKLADERLENILPLADLYIASISTTIRWALALGIPVLNYDSYRYDYGDFTGASGIIEINSASDFADALKKVLSPTGFSKLKALAEADSANWGKIDGGFRSRLRENLLEIYRNYDGNPKSTHEPGYRLPDADALKN